MAPRNPYRSALATISITALALAAMLWMIGMAVINNDPFSPEGIAAGAGLFATATSLLGLGVLALLLWLVVSSIAWQAPPEPAKAEPAKAEPAKPRVASTGPRTDLDRIREAHDAEERG